MPQFWPRSARSQLLLAAGALAALAIAFACLPPQRFAIYPVCLFHRWTGLDCPGCGITRALADLMAGHWRDAASYNPLVFVAVPAAAAFALFQGYFVLRCNCWRPIAFPGRWVNAACVGMLLFGVIRNIH
jgi:hypothetical protein